LTVSIEIVLQVLLITTLLKVADVAAACVELQTPKIYLVVLPLLAMVTL
jgi:hypothetical protein